MAKESDTQKPKPFERFAKALLAVPANELAEQKERYEREKPSQAQKDAKRQSG